MSGNLKMFVCMYVCMYIYNYIYIPWKSGDVFKRVLAGRTLLSTKDLSWLFRDADLRCFQVLKLAITGIVQFMWDHNMSQQNIWEMYPDLFHPTSFKDCPIYPRFNICYIPNYTISSLDTLNFQMTIQLDPKSTTLVAFLGARGWQCWPIYPVSISLSVGGWFYPWTTGPGCLGLHPGDGMGGHSLHQLKWTHLFYIGSLVFSYPRWNWDNIIMKIKSALRRRCSLRNQSIVAVKVCLFGDETALVGHGIPTFRIGGWSESIAAPASTLRRCHPPSLSSEMLIMHVVCYSCEPICLIHQDRVQAMCTDNCKSHSLNTDVG